MRLSPDNIESTKDRFLDHAKVYHQIKVFEQRSIRYYQRINVKMKNGLLYCSYDRFKSYSSKGTSKIVRHIFLYLVRFWNSLTNIITKVWELYDLLNIWNKSCESSRSFLYFCPVNHSHNTSIQKVKPQDIDLTNIFLSPAADGQYTRVRQLATTRVESCSNSVYFIYWYRVS